MAKLQAVQIVNPIDRRGWTSAKRAAKYVRRGQARPRPDLGDNIIEFIEADYRTISAGRTMTTTRNAAPASPPARGARLRVGPFDGMQSLRTFSHYPDDWEGYQKAA